MLHLSLLSREHQRKSFDCGNAELNTYLQQYASQDMVRRQTTCMVLTEEDCPLVLGYYTIAPYTIRSSFLPKRQIGQRDLIPVYLLGKLAVSQTLQGKGIGKLLLASAIKSCIEAPILSPGLLVEAKDERALTFYIQNGFAPLESSLLAFFKFPRWKISNQLSTPKHLDQ